MLLVIVETDAHRWCRDSSCKNIVIFLRNQLRRSIFFFENWRARPLSQSFSEQIWMIVSGITNKVNFLRTKCLKRGAKHVLNFTLPFSVLISKPLNIHSLRLHGNEFFQRNQISREKLHSCDVEWCSCVRNDITLHKSSHIVLEKNLCNSLTNSWKANPHIFETFYCYTKYVQIEGK